MKRSRRELFIHMAINKEGVFKNNQITFSPCFIFIPKTVVRFYCVDDIPSMIISIKNSRGYFFKIYIVVDRFILKSNQIMLLP